MGVNVGRINDLVPRKLEGEQLGVKLDYAIDLVRAMAESLGNVTATTPALAIGSSSKKAVLSGAFFYWSDGVLKRKASAETAFTATTHDVTANGSAARSRFYLLSINASGTITISAGTQGAVGSETTPSLPAGDTPMGLVRIEVATGATDFDATTDELDEGHITDEYQSFVGVPWPVDVGVLTRPSAI